METFEDLREDVRVYDSLEEMIDDIPIDLHVAYNPNMRIGRYEIEDESYCTVNTFDVADWTNEEKWHEFLMEDTSERYKKLFASPEFREAVKEGARIHCSVLQSFDPKDPDYSPFDEVIGGTAYSYSIL